MATIAKKKKAKPYNPLTATMPTLESIRSHARERARAVTAAGVAALPDDATVKAANASLVASLRGTVDHYGQLAGQASNAYAQNIADAQHQQASIDAGLGVVGAPVDATAGARGTLLGSMAANTLGGLTGAVIGTQQGLPGQLAALAGKRGAITKGEDAKFEEFYQAGLDDALKTAATRSNAALSQAQLESLNVNRSAQLSQGDQRIAISAANAQTSRDRLNQALRSTTDKALQAAMKKATTTINSALRAHGVITRTIGGDYTFVVPDKPIDLAAGDLKAHKGYTFTVRAKNGADALKQYAARIAQLTGKGQPLEGRNEVAALGSSYYHGDMKPITERVATTGSRSQALHEAARILEAVDGVTHEMAIAYARKLLGPAPGSKKKRAKSTATSSASR